MGYNFTITSNSLVATLDTESGKYEERILECFQPSVQLTQDRIILMEGGVRLEDFVFDVIGDINEVTPENLTDAFTDLDALIRSLFIEGDGSPTNVGYTPATGAVTSSTGTGFTIPLTDDEVRGLMSETDFNKLNAIPEYADNASAITGLLDVGAFYHTAGVLKVVIEE